MDWRRILSIVALLSVLALWASVFAGCNRDTSRIIDWETCSQSIGNHPCDFTLLDQHGKEFNLYDHYGKIIIIDLSAMWCGPCQYAATEVEYLQKKYNEDIIYVTLLLENGNYNPPSQSNIKSWARVFDIETAPVLAASRNFVSSDPNEGWSLSAWPQFHIINKDMVLVESFAGISPGLMETKILNILAQDTGAP